MYLGLLPPINNKSFLHQITPTQKVMSRHCEIGIAKEKEKVRIQHFRKSKNVKANLQVQSTSAKAQQVIQ